MKRKTTAVSRMSILRLVWLVLLGAGAASVVQAQPRERFGVVNIIPNDESSENQRNAESSLGVGSGPNIGKYLIHAEGAWLVGQPYYGSSGNEQLWTLEGIFHDEDATLDWSLGGTAYAAILTDHGLQVWRSLAPPPSVFR